MRQVFLTTLLLGLGGAALADHAPGTAPVAQVPGLIAPQPPVPQAAPAAPGSRPVAPRPNRAAPTTCGAPRAGGSGPAGAQPTPPAPPTARPGAPLPGDARPTPHGPGAARGGPAAQAPVPPAGPGAARPGAPRPGPDCGPAARDTRRGETELARISALLTRTTDARVRLYLTDARAYAQRAAQSGDPAYRAAARSLLRAAEALLRLTPAR